MIDLEGICCKGGDILVEFFLTMIGLFIGIAFFLYIGRRLQNRMNKRMTMGIAISYFTAGIVCMLLSFFIPSLFPLLFCGFPVAVCGILSVVRVHMTIDF